MKIQISRSEIKAIALLLVLALVVLTLLPDTFIDPWSIFNPRRFGIIVLVIASIEFCGYLASKLLGANKGIWLTGFLGGLVSSTAATLTAARSAQKNPSQWRRQAASASAAQLAAIFMMLPILISASPILFSAAAPVILSAGLVSFIGMIWSGAKALKDSDKAELKSPVDLKNVIGLSIFLGVILIIVNVAQLFSGQMGAMIISFLTGLFELHGLALANSVMHQEQKILLNEAILNITVAMCASFVAKAFLASTIARGPFSKFMSALALAMSFAALAAWYFIGPV